MAIKVLCLALTPRDTPKRAAVKLEHALYRHYAQDGAQLAVCTHTPARPGTLSVLCVPTSDHQAPHTGMMGAPEKGRGGAVLLERATDQLLAGMVHSSIAFRSLLVAVLRRAIKQVRLEEAYIYHRDAMISVLSVYCSAAAGVEPVLAAATRPAWVSHAGGWRSPRHSAAGLVAQL